MQIASLSHARRTHAKKDAEAVLEAGVKKLESSKETQANSKKAMQEAQSQLKALQKESTGAEKEMQAIANKKTNLSELLVMSSSRYKVKPAALRLVSLQSRSCWLSAKSMASMTPFCRRSRSRARRTLQPAQNSRP